MRQRTPFPLKIPIHPKYYLVMKWLSIKSLIKGAVFDILNAMTENIITEEFADSLITPPVGGEHVGKRLDKFLSEVFLDISRNTFIRLIKDNKNKT